MTPPRPPSAHDRAGRYGDGREEEEAESSEDGNTLETEVERGGRRHFRGPGLEGDDDGRDIDNFQPAEVEENTADSEEDGDLML